MKRVLLTGMSRTGTSSVVRALAARRYEATARPQPDIGRDLGDSDYRCVVDAAGNAVSLITSLSSAFGAGVVVGSTGVVELGRVPLHERQLSSFQESQFSGSDDCLAAAGDAQLAVHRLQLRPDGVR